MGYQTEERERQELEDRNKTLLNLVSSTDRKNDALRIENDKLRGEIERRERLMNEAVVVIDAITARALAAEAREARLRWALVRIARDRSGFMGESHADCMEIARAALTDGETDE